MRYGSVCSGIEAATAAWHHMAWEPAFFSEIEAFPRAVLSHHYPEVPLHGDFTTIEKNQYGKIDLLVGGTPCQSFSVAGLRGGLDDQRGNLALEFCRLAQREQPRWIVWENVPGVLSSGGGRDFGSILGALEELGYGLAYRVLDAQYFGVAQRRRRVFVVGYLGDWRPAAAVLFERHSMSGHPAPSREARQDAASGAAAGAASSGQSSNVGNGQGTLAAGAHPPAVAFDWQSGGDSRGLDPKPTAQLQRSQVPAVAYSIMPMNSGKDYKARETEVAQPIMAGGPVSGNQGGDFVVTPFTLIGGVDYENNGHEPWEPTGPIMKGSPSGGGQPQAVVQTSAVRRLTPVECERLQGFPDNFTGIPWKKKGPEHCPDGPRYKALGNSMAVPVMRWIGERIQIVDDLISLL